MLITRRNKNILDLLGKIKYILKINFPWFFFYILNVATRTFKMTSVAHISELTLYFNGTALFLTDKHFEGNLQGNVPH